jgi:prolyl oligopeptidase
MARLTEPPPSSQVEPVTEVLHGVPITDPYRWLEDQDSPRTRAWIEQQTLYTRAYLERIPGRERTRQRIQELLDVETYDSFLKSGSRYFFRKRLRGQEQPCIYLRQELDGSDELLVDPSERKTGTYSAVRPLRVSSDGNLLLYEVKQGGERTGTFEILDVRNRKTLPDSLPHGYLRGFAFAPDSNGFYYVHEDTAATRPLYRAMYSHALGSSRQDDREIFCAGEDKHIRLTIFSDACRIGLLVRRFLETTVTDFYVLRMGNGECPVPVLRGADWSFAPRFLRERILAATDRDAPNRKIVEVQPTGKQDPVFLTLVAEADAAILNWRITAHHIFVAYACGTRTQIDVFDPFGKRVGQIPCDERETVRLITGTSEDNDVLIARESFVRPAQTDRYIPTSGEIYPAVRRKVPFDPNSYASIQSEFSSRDGTSIPIFLVGRPTVLAGGPYPAIMTSYGGFGIPMTPQFSVFVAFLIERGFLFALPNIRGGSEFGAAWHNAAKRRKRQVAVDDFLGAAEWLVQTGRSEPARLAAFGGSNSGLLVAAALTQRPDLFRAIICMVPMLDMLRYHLFDNAHIWTEEFGTVDNPDDFAALREYSPYQNVRNGTAYPATMMVSGDADQNCNPMHARKMTARLQAANTSENPILLDYSQCRGHAPVLPLSARITALTDRMAFLCEQLGVNETGDGNVAAGPQGLLGPNSF